MTFHGTQPSHLKEVTLIIIEYISCFESQLIGTVGTVHRITQTGDIRVQYPLESPAAATTSSATPTSSSDNNRWTFNPAALSRVANGE